MLETLLLILTFFNAEGSSQPDLIDNEPRVTIGQVDVIEDGTCIELPHIKTQSNE